MPGDKLLRKPGLGEGLVRLIGEGDLRAISNSPGLCTGEILRPGERDARSNILLPCTEGDLKQSSGGE